MDQLTISEAGFITGRGTVVFFTEQPRWLPGRKHRVRVANLDGTEFEAIAQVEFARKVPPGEVAVLFFAGKGVADFPSGSHVTLLSEHAGA